MNRSRGIKEARRPREGVAAEKVKEISCVSFSSENLKSYVLIPNPLLELFA